MIRFTSSKLEHSYLVNLLKVAVGTARYSSNQFANSLIEY